MDKQNNNRLNTILLYILPILIIITIGVCGNSSGVCGWDEMFNGNIITASFVMFDDAFAGWTIAILFFVYQFTLLLKTRNLTISWVSGVLFAAMFVGAKAISAVGSPFFKPISGQIIFVILVLELGAILYLWLFK
jgi:hypothetical protein